ncbi:hypothetical protein AX16_002646 [Volvariella volvacea WC 439]|nr:hypothetical protein AX16_002646 [Volvariella volvacea WC 439]
MRKHAPQAVSRRDGVNTGVKDKYIPSPVTPAVTGIVYPSPVDAPPLPTPPPSTSMMSKEPTRNRSFRSSPNNTNSSSYQSHQPLPSSQQRVEMSSNEDFPETPPDNGLDQLWGKIRNQKSLKMAKEPSKVQSLEEALGQLHIDTQEADYYESPPRENLTRQKSITSFRESTDGHSIVATFAMPESVNKQDVHVSFRRDRLVVTWETYEVAEWEEDGQVIVERLIHNFHRTLPLPEGTKLDEIYCSMRDHRLTLRYPNMRCIRVDGKSKTGGRG